MCFRYHMLVFGYDEKVEYSRDCCFRMLERLKMQNWALGKSKVYRSELSHEKG